MTSTIGRGVAAATVIGGGALAATGIAGSIDTSGDDQALDVTTAIAGGIGLAGGATALATSGRVGTVARMVALGATALAGVTALVSLVGGTRRHERGSGTVPSVAAPTTTTTPTRSASPTPSTTPSPSSSTSPSTTTTTPSTAPGPAPTPPTTSVTPTPTPTPVSPKDAWAQAVARSQVRVDTVQVVADGLRGSDAQLAAIHPQYSKIYRHALNERLATPLPIEGAVDWTAVATSIDTNHDAKLDYDERKAGGRSRAHDIAAYSAGVDEILRAGGDFSDAARIRAGETLLKQWNGPVQPGQNPGDTYGVADTLMADAGVTRRPDDSADWTAVARHVDAKLASYGF